MLVLDVQTFRNCSYFHFVPECVYTVCMHGLFIVVICLRMEVPPPRPC